MEKYFAGLERYPGTDSLSVPQRQGNIPHEPMLLPKDGEKQLRRIQEEVAETRIENFRTVILERLAETASSEISGQTFVQMASEIERANRIIQTIPGATEEQKARLNQELMTQLDRLTQYADIAN